ncbi:MAG: three-Cys-motif partner protein TcmP [Candidatus Falkowbacteria bacterium]
MSIKTSIWELEPHTNTKHEILKRYLQRWLPILGTFNKGLFYIDGFAGPGVYTNGEKGSPIIAIKTAIDLIKEERLKTTLYCLFIEKDPERCKILEREINQIDIPKQIKIKIKNKDFLSSMDDVLNNRLIKVLPTLIFIDPFGFSHTPFCLIKKIMMNNICDFFINFNYEEIERFLSLSEQENNFINFFGCEEWKRALILKNKDKRKFLHDLYIKQLHKEAGIKYIRSFTMINKSNKIDYFLFFGTNSIKGLEKIKEVLWKIDKDSGNVFSDTTNPNQPKLFTSSYFNDLQKEIIKKFKGEAVTIKELKDYILTETPYPIGPLSTKILKPLEREKNLLITVSNRKKKFTYPDGCKINFL